MEIIKTVSIEHPLDVACREIGGRLELANALGVTVAAIGNWKTRGVPIEHCTAIEQRVNGKVSRRELRPDDWQKIWPELAAAVRAA
ncbi:MAG: helix-turn-helix domain-containing protein [Rhodoferax sp.]|nr:helix-turn-helix domain-containing protein [Rhodoferax sp.]